MGHARGTKTGARPKHAWVLPVLIYLYDSGFVRNYSLSQSWMPFHLRIYNCLLTDAQCVKQKTNLQHLRGSPWFPSTPGCQELSAVQELWVGARPAFTQRGPVSLLCPEYEIWFGNHTTPLAAGNSSVKRSSYSPRDWIWFGGYRAILGSQSGVEKGAPVWHPCPFLCPRMGLGTEGSWQPIGTCPKQQVWWFDSFLISGQTGIARYQLSLWSIFWFSQL